ncbi:Tn3 family transposase [Streptomyces sp. DH37]|uniref:Tn3 family transposase n=1 Tax=Streptomyces sp. DH37 TaxID=3040122 RepID=UPI0024435F25|nr:Tn3 family transposase [Streptomyces sp. DH37]MDG9703292.1 Tn3 family transposase [Streptomyces sp. DH37]
MAQHPISGPSDPQIRSIAPAGQKRPAKPPSGPGTARQASTAHPPPSAPHSPGLRLLQLVSDEGHRRMIGAQLNVTGARHRLARKIFVGQCDELRQHYRAGTEDQLGALGRKTGTTHSR